MPELLDKALAQAAIEMMDPPSRGMSGDLKTALETLVRLEQFRRGAPEPLTGAIHPLALTQGHLLRSELDLSVHAHTGWQTGAVIADVRELIHVNEVCRFVGGEEVLKATASALVQALPGTRLLRVHGDCFAALFLPSSGLELEAEHLERASRELRDMAPDLRSRVGSDRPLQWTLSALRLRVLDPPHWIVLGPLLIAEIERAHLLARRGLASGIQERELRMDARVPPAPSTPRE